MRWYQTTSADHGLDLSCSICSRTIVPSDDDIHADECYTPHPNEDEFNNFVQLFGVDTPSDVAVCHDCLEQHVDYYGSNGVAVFANTDGTPKFGRNADITYDEACEHFHAWAKTQAMQEGYPFAITPQPNAGLSEEIDGVWHLENVDGRLAKVYPDGVVIPWVEDGTSPPKLDQYQREELDAKAALDYCHRLIFHRHAGVLDLEDKYVVFANRGLGYVNEKVRVLATSNAWRWSVASTEDGVCWAVVIYDFERKIRVDELERFVAQAFAEQRQLAEEAQR